MSIMMVETSGIIDKISLVEKKEISSICVSYVLGVVKRVSVIYGIDISEMLVYLGSKGYSINENENENEECREIVGIKGKKCILPFCGKILDSCHGIKLNYGLYSQCMNERVVNGRYCKTCEKQGKKNSTGKPTYGDITERISNMDNWRDKKGKEAIRYANVMDKLEITREMAEKSALEWGVTIPEKEFEIKEVKRGRPKKSVAVSDTDSEVSIEPKKRGRPRINKTVISELSPGDDLIAGLIKEAKKTKDTIPILDKNEEEVKTPEASIKQDKLDLPSLVLKDDKVKEEEKEELEEELEEEGVNVGNLKLKRKGQGG